MHQRAGNENAYALPEYIQAIDDAGLKRITVLYPWDTLINAFPEVRSVQEFEHISCPMAA